MIRISATDSYLSYIPDVERTYNLELPLVLGLVKIGGPIGPGPWTGSMKGDMDQGSMFCTFPSSS